MLTFKDFIKNLIMDAIKLRNRLSKGRSHFVDCPVYRVLEYFNMFHDSTERLSDSLIYGLKYVSLVSIQNGG